MGKEAFASLDAGYTGVTKREEIKAAHLEGKIRSDIQSQVAERRSVINKMAEGPLKVLKKALERAKAQVRAKVEPSVVWAAGDDASRHWCALSADKSPQRAQRRLSGPESA